MKQATVLVLALALAACGGKATSGGKVGLSTHVATTAPADPTPSGLSITVGTHTVVLDRARFLIRKVVLEAEGTETGDSGSGDMGGTSGTGGSMAKADSASGDPGDSGDGSDGSDSTAGDDTVVRAGPLVIDLSGTQLTGGVALVFDQTVPAGTYDDLKFQIHKLTPGESVTDTAFQPNGDSIILDLTVDGVAAQFVTDLTAVAEVPGPLVVPEGGAINVTVSIDPGKWFTAADGSFLDPTMSANQGTIEQNIRSSIRGFEDDDGDGAPDHS